MNAFKTVAVALGITLAAIILIPLIVLAGLFVWLKVTEEADEEILELTYVTTLYEMHATICRALRLEYDDVEERVTEVAAPAGAAIDVMRMVDS